MSRPTTQAKLIILTAVIFSIFLAGFILLYKWDNRQAQLLLEDKEKEKSALLDRLITLRSEPFHTLAYDYSFWDEMVDFVQSGDKSWGDENIQVSLSTFGADIAWVYHLDWQLVYCAANSQAESLLHDYTLPGIFAGAFKKEFFSHFFIPTNIGLMEVHIAPIQPSADAARSTPPQGIFVVGKVWSREYIVNFEQSLDVKMVMMQNAHTTENNAQEYAGMVHFSHVFPGSDAEAVAQLSCTATSAFYNDMQAAARMRLIYLAACSLAILILLSKSLRAWVGRPLGIITEVLRSGNSVELQKLHYAGREFEDIGELVNSFLGQRSQLQKEVVERTRAEESLRDRERLLRSTLESTADGILVVGSDGAVTHWNEKFRDMWRIPNELVDTRNDGKLLEFVLNQLCQPKQFLNKVKELYVSSEASFDVLQFIDGRVFERHSCSLMRDKYIVGRVWSFRDVTQRVRAEEARRHLQERLEKAQRMESLGVLAGGVAHDLNNTLGPIVGYSELLMREFPVDSKAAVKLGKIAKSAHDAAVVIQDLLTLSRRGRCEMNPTDLNQVIQGYVESPAFENLREINPNVAIELSLSSSIGLIHGSAPHLEKAIMNLVINAFESMPAGGTLMIQTQRFFVEKLVSGYGNIEKGDYALVRIKDSGSGIPKEDIERIFEPYFSKKKMGRSGSGLGLPVVYGVVKDHNGYYDILSELNEGTEFILYFPISLQGKPAGQPIQALVKGGSETILVVDDNADQREMAKEIISALGYTVHVAENGHRAVEFLSRSRADLVLLDMIMEPNFDGLETYQEILRINPHQKAIVVSGYSATERVQRMLELGASSYIKKPYSIENLVMTIRAVLDSRPSLAIS